MQAYFLTAGLLLGCLRPDAAVALMMDDPMPPCAKPGMDIGMKSGAALGGLGSTVYRDDGDIFDGEFPGFSKNAIKKIDNLLNKFRLQIVLSDC